MLLLMIFAVVSCGLEQIGGETDGGGEVWFGPGSIVAGNGSGGTSGAGKKVWYAVGVDYQDGYDWQADVEKGSVRCSLVVFANGMPMMKVPVGETYEVSADPDMHRMIGDDLYTDYSSESETVIKRNGEQLFRYEGREMIVDMEVDGGYVYTLGQQRDGSGFAFRRNGEVLLERTTGYVFSDLARCEDGFDFAFCEVIGSGKEAVERYYSYCSGDVTQVAVRDDVRKVWDIMIHEGRVCYLATMVGISSIVLVAGDEMDTLALPAVSEVISCRFVRGSMMIEGVISQKGKALFSGLWDGKDMVKMFSPGYLVTSIYGSGDNLCCVLNSPGMLADGMIYRCGELFAMPDGYRSMGGRSVVMSDGLLYVGLTSDRDSDVESDSEAWSNEAAVWIEGEMKPLKINGFISHISVY